MRREKSFRGISKRLAIHYLENLGGRKQDEDTVATDDWTATCSAEKVTIGATLQLTEVTIVFEGEEKALDALIDEFSKKAMRAGG